MKRPLNRLQEATGVKDHTLLHFIQDLNRQRQIFTEEVELLNMPGLSHAMQIELKLRDWAKENMRENPLLDVKGTSFQVMYCLEFD